MRKIFSFLIVFLLVFPAAACGQNREEEEKNGKAEFDFERKTVMLNSGYVMPINGLGTYSLHGDECMNSVRSALSNGVRLIDTASAYGNEGSEIWESNNSGIRTRQAHLARKVNLFYMDWPFYDCTGKAVRLRCCPDP